MKTLTLASACLALAACVNTAPYRTPEEVALKTAVVPGQDNASTILGPAAHIRSGVYWFLSADMAQGKPAGTYRVNLGTTASRAVTLEKGPPPEGWARYPNEYTVWVYGDQIDRATDAVGAPLDLQVVSRVTEGEVVAVEYLLTHAELNRGSGFKVRFYGQNGERVVFVPPVYLDGFLRRLESQ